MRRKIAIGMVGLAVAGCAQSRSTMPQAPGPRPVGMSPVPTLSETINRGTGDPAIQQTALGDPRSPKWAGSFMPPGHGNSTSAGAGTSPGARPAAESLPGAAAAGKAITPSPSSPPAGPLEAAKEAEPPSDRASIPPDQRDAPPSTGAELPAVVPAAAGAAATVAKLPPAESPPAAVGDPLLGPNPDVMPAVDPAAKTPGRPESAAPRGGEAPLEAAPGLPDDARPAAGALSPSPAPESGAAGSASATPAQPSAAAPLLPAPKPEPGVHKASYSPGATLDTDIDRNWKEAGRSAARVGNEVITLHDLVLNVKEQLKRNPPGRDLTKPELNMVAKSVLAGLIERTLIAQEAKRILKNPKQLDRLYELADKYWREEELPPMMRRYLVETESQLRDKFEESGRSLETLHQSFRQEFLAQAFLDQKLSDRRKVELPEMLKYYSEHLHDKDFDRPAQITWREIVIEKGRYPNEADARRKAEALLGRLKKGEDFASLARSESEGPSSIKAQGGLMQTSPGSYALEAVNQALESLPLNQVSPVIEGSTSLHIVRVDSRRASGPASFEEVQDQARRAIMVGKMRKAREEFIVKLKRNTPITTIFDGTDSDPTSAENE